MDEDTFSFAARTEHSPAKRPPLEVRMTVVLRPTAIKMLLIAAGVLLGLLTIALMLLPEAHAAHGVVLGAKTTYSTQLHPLSVRWH
jgi:hypothetical protein